MRPTGFLVATLLSLAAASPSAGADAANGLRIARRWCAECHLVTQDQSRAKADAMPFASVATRKTAQEIATFLTDPHPKMPNMGLSRNEIADIVAYIKSLGSAPADTPPAAPEKSPADLPKSG